MIMKTTTLFITTTLFLLCSFTNPANDSRITLGNEDAEAHVVYENTFIIPEFSSEEAFNLAIAQFELFDVKGANNLNLKKGDPAYIQNLSVVRKYYKKTRNDKHVEIRLLREIEIKEQKLTVRFVTDEYKIVDRNGFRVRSVKSNEGKLVDQLNNELSEDGEYFYRFIKGNFRDRPAISNRNLNSRY